MPVLFTRRDPDHISGPDFLNGSAPALHPPAARGDNEMLAQRVGVPECSSARLNVTLMPCARDGAVTSKRGSMRTVPVNQSDDPFLEGCEPALLMSMCNSFCSVVSCVNSAWARDPRQPESANAAPIPVVFRKVRRERRINTWVVSRGETNSEIHAPNKGESRFQKPPGTLQHLPPHKACGQWLPWISEVEMI